MSQFDWNYYLPSFAPTELYSPILLQHNLLHTLDIESACKLQRFRDRIFDLTKQGIVKTATDTLGVVSVQSKINLRSSNRQKVLRFCLCIVRAKLLTVLWPTGELTPRMVGGPSQGVWVWRSRHLQICGFCAR